MHGHHPRAANVAMTFLVQIRRNFSQSRLPWLRDDALRFLHPSLAAAPAAGGAEYDGFLFSLEHLLRGINSRRQRIGFVAQEFVGLVELAEDGGERLSETWR